MPFCFVSRSSRPGAGRVTSGQPGQRRHISSLRRAPAAAAAAPAAAITTAPPPKPTPSLDSWPAIEASARAAAGPALDGYNLIPGGEPASLPWPVLPVDDAGPTRASTAPIIFFRDTHGWCPFAQRVAAALNHLADAGAAGARAEVCCINLRDKPAFYPTLVPTSKVPALLLASAGQLASAGDAGVPSSERELVYESLDILARLDADFPGVLTPPGTDAAAATAALSLADKFGTAGYGLVRAAAAAGGGGGGSGTATASPSSSPASQTMPPPPPLDEARAAFEAVLQEWEALLASTPGDFLAGPSVSLSDFALAPMAERLASTIPAAARAGTAVRGRADLPRVNAWYVAMEGVPAYRRVRGDPATHRAVFGKIAGSRLAASPYEPADPAAAAEAAAKLALNRAAVVADTAKNAGVPPGSEAAIEAALARVAACLLTGQPGAPAEDAPANAVAAAVCAFLCARVSAPRDMSGGAATELRAACARVLRGCYNAAL